MQTEQNNTWTTLFKNTSIWLNAEVFEQKPCGLHFAEEVCCVFSFPVTQVHKTRGKHWVNIFIEFQPGLWTTIFEVFEPRKQYMHFKILYPWLALFSVLVNSFLIIDFCCCFFFPTRFTRCTRGVLCTIAFSLSGSLRTSLSSAYSKKTVFCLFLFGFLPCFISIWTTVLVGEFRIKTAFCILFLT